MVLERIRQCQFYLGLHPIDRAQEDAGRHLLEHRRGEEPSGEALGGVPRLRTRPELVEVPQHYPVVLKIV